MQSTACGSYLQLITMTSGLPRTSERLLLMTPTALIEHELTAAEAARHDNNDGKARVCARRAVALATEAWLAQLSIPRWRGDAMAHLRQIQQDESFPPPIRQAAERLSTPVTHQHTAPFTTDPVADARLIIAHLSSTKGGA
jgi:hypothetical protein